MNMYRLLVLSIFCLWYTKATGEMTIRIDEGMRGAIPIAVVPFRLQGSDAIPTEDISAVISADLTRSGRFRTLAGRDMPSRPSTREEINFDTWRNLGQDDLIIGQVQRDGSGYSVQFQLFDMAQKQQIVAYRVPTTNNGLRTTAHWIADFIYEKLTGTSGAFSTRLAYVAEETGRTGSPQLSIQIADIDGYNPQSIVKSTEPLMSPTWSPDGRRLAYVSFENKQQSIYIQDLDTGRRERVSDYPGINSAPAWAPDGKRLALVLSKDGDPEIYVMSLNDHQLTRITSNIAIDTEPSWSPDGRNVVFTSDRGGTPQIYQVSANGGEAKRLTFDGDYNARPVYSPDGLSIALVTKQGDDFKIGLLDLSSGNVQTITDGPLDESPSFVANGGIILYDSKLGGRGQLFAVSTSGRLHKSVVIDDSNVRTPACSPKIK